MIKNKLLTKIIILISFLSTLTYLTWRIFFTIPFHDSPFAWIFGIILWISEVGSSFTAFVLIFNKNKEFHLKKPNPSELQYPDIDIFIATHNEDENIVYKTVNACVNLIYPDPSKIHIFICDDTNRANMKKLAHDFKIGYIGMDNNKQAKSGNLNNALSKTSSPYIATFDADMIPFKNFLMETVPYFLKDGVSKDGRKIGLIQTPQSFYNADIFQFHLFSEENLPNEQDFFSKSVNVLNNIRGAAVYTGSNTLLSRQAIEDAGRFPTETITEDFELGVRMNIAGYSNYSTEEPMASGLTPTSLRSVIKQRIRWGRGVIRSSYNTNIFFNKNLTLGQRIVYINGFLYWSSFFRRLLYIVAPILFTVFHIRIVIANVWLLLFFWLPSYVLTRSAMSDVTDNYRSQTWGEIVETIFSPYLVFPLLLELLGIKEKSFKVTSKQQEDISWDYQLALPYIILWVLSVYGLITFNMNKFGLDLFYGSVISFWLIHHIINLTFAIFVTIGRPIYRSDERFLVNDNARVKLLDTWYPITLHDVSENGLSFISSPPLYIKDKCTIEIKNIDETFLIDCRVIRVFQKDDQWLYGMRITQPSEEIKRKYLQFVFSGPNGYLTDHRNAWITVMDDLTENIVRRLELRKNMLLKNTKEVLLLNPRINVNYPIEILKEKGMITKFSNEQLTCRFKFNVPSRGDVLLILFDQPLVLSEFKKNTLKNEVTYKIVNFNNINSNEMQQLYLKLWGDKIAIN